MASESAIGRSVVAVRTRRGVAGRLQRGPKDSAVSGRGTFAFAGSPSDSFQIEPAPRFVGSESKRKERFGATG